MYNFVEVLHVTQWISLKCLKVALVGSYKGSCRLYNTSGMNSLSLSLSTQYSSPVLSLLLELFCSPFQKINCNKKVKLICKIRRRNHIRRKSLVSR